MTEATKTTGAATWGWRMLGQPAAPARQPMGRQAKACLQAGVMAVVGLCLYFLLHHRVMPVVLGAMAVLVLAGGFLIPPLFAAFERAGVALAKGVGAGLTWGLLVPFFYLVFLPGRLVLMLRGRDPMDRRFPDPRPSLWVPRPAVRSVEQYRKQH